MSSAGRAANSNGCVLKPKEHATGLIGFAAQIRRSSLIGSCAMETAEHREPCESRGSRTDLGAPGGEIPPGDSTLCMVRPRVARGFRRSVRCGSCINVSGLILERVMLRATMDISAHAISLTSRPRPGQQGHQYSHAPGRPIFHLVLTSRRPRRRVSRIDLTTSSRAPHFARPL